MISYFSGIFEPFTGSLGLGIAILAIVVGFISLFFGRRLYWFFVGVAGFLLGLMFAPLLFTNLNPAWHPWISIFVGIVFALLALALNKFMISLAGAIGLGSVVYVLVAPNMSQGAVIVLSVIAAVIGFIVAWLLFDWGLMIFSALAGSSLVTSGIVSLIPSVATVDLIIFLALFIIGLIYQISVWSRSRVQTEVID